jgi:hypothetical protein
MACEFGRMCDGYRCYIDVSKAVAVNHGNAHNRQVRAKFGKEFLHNLNRLGSALWIDLVWSLLFFNPGTPNSWVTEQREYPSVQAYIRSRDSVVGIATSYGLDDRGVRVRVPVGSRIFSSTNRPYQLWGPPNLLSNGYRGLFPPLGKAAGAWSWPLT